MNQNHDPGATAVLLASLLASAPGTHPLRADCLSPPPGLIAWWRAESTALDQVGTKHGTLLNGATFAPGLVDQAFSFDDLNDLLQVADAPELNPPTITP
jgi:hypothetical protein